jgi:hypothetical protein
LFREYTKHEQNGKELGNLTVLLLAYPSSFFPLVSYYGMLLLNMQRISLVLLQQQRKV